MTSTQATRSFTEGKEEENPTRTKRKMQSLHHHILCANARPTASAARMVAGPRTRSWACCFWTLNSLSRNKNPLPMFHMLLGDISAFSSTNARCTPYTVSEIRKISCWWRFTFRMAGQLVVRYPQSRTNHTRRHILALDGLCFPSATIKFFLSCTPYKNTEHGVPRSSPVR